MLIIFTGLCFILGWIGSLCGQSKGQERAGFWLGFFLGPIGCIIAALLPAVNNRPYASSSPDRTKLHKACSLCGKLADRYTRTCTDCGNPL